MFVDSVRRDWTLRWGGGELLMEIEPWYLGPVPTYIGNKHKDRRDIRQQAADRRQTAFSIGNIKQRSVSRKTESDCLCCYHFIVYLLVRFCSI
jgi:hypothetical protein